jgi:hypothetical protein
MSAIDNDTDVVDIVDVCVAGLADNPIIEVSKPETTRNDPNWDSAFLMVFNGSKYSEKATNFDEIGFFQIVKYNSMPNATVLVNEMNLSTFFNESNDDTVVTSLSITGETVSVAIGFPPIFSSGYLHREGPQMTTSAPWGKTVDGPGVRDQGRVLVRVKRSPLDYSFELHYYFTLNEAVKKAESYIVYSPNVTVEQVPQAQLIKMHVLPNDTRNASAIIEAWETRELCSPLVNKAMDEDVWTVASGHLLGLRDTITCFFGDANSTLGVVPTPMPTPKPTLPEPPSAHTPAVPYDRIPVSSLAMGPTTGPSPSPAPT